MMGTTFCERTGCKYRKPANVIQPNTMVCHKQAITISKRGFCQSKEKAG